MMLFRATEAVADSDVFKLIFKSAYGSFVAHMGCGRLRQADLGLGTW